MKKLTKLLSLLLVFAVALGVVACSSFSKIERELKDDGYVLLVDKLDSQKEYEKVNGVTEVHVFTKTITVGKLPATCIVYVLEFNSTEKLVAYAKVDKTLQNVVNNISKKDSTKTIHSKLEKLGVACGDYLVIAVGLDADEVYEEIADIND